MNGTFVWLKGRSHTILSPHARFCLTGLHQNYTHGPIAAVFVSSHIISELLLHDGCVVTNERVEAMCEDSWTETLSDCGRK